MKIPFTGNPKPRIIWKKDGETVESGAHFAVKTEERHALLTITDCTKGSPGSSGRRMEKLWNLVLISL